MPSYQDWRPKAPIGTYVDILPTDALKRETANRFEYTPEARELLYNTPTTVFVLHPDDPQPQGYRPATRFINPTLEFLGINPMEEVRFGHNPAAYPDWIDEEDTLGHEFAHKWFNTQLTSEERNDWKWNMDQELGERAEETWRSYAPQSYRNRYELLSTGTNAAAGIYLQPTGTPRQLEVYAMMGATPWRLTQEQRDRYYPGLFQKGNWTRAGR